MMLGIRGCINLDAAPAILKYFKVKKVKKV